MADDANPRVAIGDNNPPVPIDPPDPFPGFHVHINDLFDEARNFLDGEGIKTEGEAEAVSKLMDMLRTAARDADIARVAEKKPHDDKAKLVQQKWKPLIERADLAIDTCKKALSPYLQRKEEEQRRAAENARAAADRAAQVAREALQATDVTDLTARAAAEGLAKDAKRADADAARAEKARPQATGGARATTLRSTFRPELVSGTLALKHYLGQNPDAIRSLLVELATADVREGKRTIPGFVIHEEKVVV